VNVGAARVGWLGVVVVTGAQAVTNDRRIIQKRVFKAI
jgi:hypothetical protein